ncbi:hypothetical protein [Streptomyces sp. NPDC048057]|uniref:hypothetical protein n=1 Tax=Streptomyces sp. NPDC048057 TaxID=3155628 RepID=UPI0033C1EFA9
MFDLSAAEVGAGTVGEEDAAGLRPAVGEECLAFLDQPVRAAGVAEVEERLAGVDGEVGVGEPVAERWPPVRGGGAKEVLGGVQGPVGRPLLALGGERAGVAELEEGAGGGVLRAGECCWPVGAGGA